ncbi:hypothetical protein IAR55_006981 [Kwoniella newhampshirensis]|uniref:Vacuolar protein sorting-associated protein VTA1 n=1 Tax=Kwoniella newhampshirensis TaxID=1651941 RepID=A0AAW0YFS0_9TREE
MDSVNIPTESVPDALKGIEQILKRAKELKKAEPVVAYWCCFSAAQKALKVQNRSKEETLFLMSVIDALEQMKAILANNEGITSEAAGAAHVENFALKVFMSADNDDRAGNTGKATIRKFVVAGQFIEVLRCFENGMTEEMEQKVQYARWKAADGAKALREGRTPSAGPPIPEADITAFPTLPGESPNSASTQLPQSPPLTSNGGSARGSFTSTTRPTISARNSPPVDSPSSGPVDKTSPDLNSSAPVQDDFNTPTPTRAQSTTSGAWSTVATPGLPDDESDEYHFDLNRPQVVLPSAPPFTPPEQTSPTGERKNVRFMGPDGAPLSPASTHITVGSYDAPPAPPPTDFTSPPSSPKSSNPPVVLAPPPSSRPRGDSAASTTTRSNGQQPTSADRQRGDPPSSAPVPKPDTANASRISTAPPLTTVPPPPPPSLASYPSHPPAQVQPHGLGLTSPQPSQPHDASVLSAPPRNSFSRKEVEQTQKHAKWAISALEFDDYETARSELRKALNILGG